MALFSFSLMEESTTSSSRATLARAFASVGLTWDDPGAEQNKAGYVFFFSVFLCLWVTGKSRGEILKLQRWALD